MIQEYKKSNILIVTGKKSFYSSGAQEILTTILKDHNCIYFSDFEPNPKINDLKKGSQIAKCHQTDLIIAIGGGSVLDMAKLIKATINRSSSIEDIIRGLSKINIPNIPIIAIPTTAGSGSESTHFAVAYIDNSKYSVADKCLLPDQVILDGNLLKSATRYQKACSCLDAFAQAIESMWAVNATDESRSIALKAIILCKENISDFVNKEFDANIYQNMIEAANLSGQAINISKTTAPHAWSYAISINHEVPHGHAVWLTLPKIFKIHAEISEKNSNLKDLKNTMIKLKSLLGINSNDKIQKYFSELLNNIDIKFDLANDIVLDRNERMELSTSVNQERLLNNPISFSKEHINFIFSLKEHSHI